MKNIKQKTQNCSYRIFVVCRSPVSSSFGPGFFCLNLGWLCPNRVCAQFSRSRGNWWYPLDITSIGIDGTPLVPSISLCPGLLGYTSSGCPTVCVLCWASIGTGGGGAALPQTSMPTIYKQHLYNMTPYTLKIWARSWKNLFPVLGDNRTLRMRQPDH